MQATRPKKDLCQVCTKNEFKYKCPRCLKLTCCLDCIKKHKADTGCDGVKQTEKLFKQKFMMNDIDLKVLRDDMRFMGGAIDTVNKLRKFKANVHERETESKEDKLRARQ